MYKVNGVTERRRTRTHNQNCLKLEDPEPNKFHNFCSPNHSHNFILQILSETGIIGLLLFYGFWISTTLPILSILLPGCLGLIQRGITSQRHHKIIRKLLGQTTSPEIAEQLWLSRDSIIKDGKLYGKEQIVTALFLDICYF